jgi:adenosylcobinamide kinase/adenosylcobinamide-phosphate guanylyltransferase
MKPVIFVLGGARSGKSRFAEQRAASFPEPRIFLATAEAGDAEMAARIARHRAERSAGWRTIEEPKEIAPVIRDDPAGVILVDCLTIWLANVMSDDPGADVAAPLDELLGALRVRRSPVIAVSNEVGFGIVPEYPLARAYRDAAGLMNQRIADLADEAHFLVAGQPMRLK